MAKQKDALKKIVALKRQSAEQRVRVLQTDAERMEAALVALSEALRNIDTNGSGFDTLRLAEEHGHSRKLISDMRAGETALVEKRAELHDAREALKRAFHSEERLGEILSKG